MYFVLDSPIITEITIKHLYILCSVASIPMPESTLVSLAVFHLGIFGARIVLDSTVDIACAKVVKDYYRHHRTQEEMTNLKIK